MLGMRYSTPDERARAQAVTKEVQKVEIGVPRLIAESRASLVDAASNARLLSGLYSRQRSGAAMRITRTVIAFRDLAAISLIAAVATTGFAAVSAPTLPAEDAVACAIFTPAALEKATGLTHLAIESGQANGCHWKSADKLRTGGSYASGYNVMPGQFFQMALAHGGKPGADLPPGAISETLTVDGIQVLLVSMPVNLDVAVQTVYVHFLAAPDKYVSASIGLPATADGKTIGGNLVRLLLANKSKLPNAPDLSDDDDTDDD